MAAPAVNHASRSLRFTYFACRGRGEALRLQLAAAGVPWEDDRVPLNTCEARWASWRALKLTPRTGPLGTLPVLHRLAEGGGSTTQGRGVGGKMADSDFVVTEQLAIATYLMATVGPEAASGPSQDAPCPERMAVSTMLASSAYLGLCTPLIELMWLPIRRPGVEAAAAVEALAGITAPGTGTLARLDAMLTAQGSRGGPFFAGAEPGTGDLHMFEAIHRMACAVGGVGDGSEAASAPRDAPYDSLGLPPGLRQMCEGVAATPAVGEYLDAGRMPARISGSPIEGDMLSVLRAEWPAAVQRVAVTAAGSSD